jgi:hypothetical protein
MSQTYDLYPSSRNKERYIRSWAYYKNLLSITVPTELEFSDIFYLQKKKKKLTHVSQTPFCCYILDVTPDDGQIPEA